MYWASCGVAAALAGLLKPYPPHNLAGLHEGVKSLVEGGAPPGFLIIDDGWQCTDVDEPLRQVWSITTLGMLLAACVRPCVLAWQAAARCFVRACFLRFCRGK